MNISQEKTENHTATIKIELSKEDYAEQVNKSLKDYHKNANIPGFRPGKVPIGMIKKMYGKAVLAEEINKILSESLNKYITENKIKIIGHPLPDKDKFPELELGQDHNFEFFFTIGFVPEIDLTISDKIKVDHYNIIANDKTIDKYIEGLRKKFGEIETTEVTNSKDILRGEITQMDKNGNLMKNGIKNTTTIVIEMLKDKDQQSKFIDIKMNDTIIFNPLKAIDNKTEIAHMLGVKVVEADKIVDDFQFTVNEIIRIKPANLNKDFFNKVYPGQNIKTTEQFREMIAKEAQVNYEQESNKQLMSDVMEKLISETDITLPDEFLKRWLLENEKGKLTKGQLEDEYENYAKALRWQLIQNKIITDHHIEVKEDDIRNFIKGYFSHHGHEDPEINNRLEEMVDSVMKNKEEVSKIYEQLYDQKLRELFKSELKLKTKKVTSDEFIKIISKTK